MLHLFPFKECYIIILVPFRNQHSYELLILDYENVYAEM